MIKTPVGISQRVQCVAQLYGSYPNPPDGCEATAAYRLFVSIKEKWVLKTSKAVWLAEHILPAEYGSSQGSHAHFHGVFPRTQRAVVLKELFSLLRMNSDFLQAETVVTSFILPSPTQ